MSGNVENSGCGPGTSLLDGLAIDDEGEKTLAVIFQEGLDLYNNLGKIDEPTNSCNVQANVKRAIKILENATRLVSMAGVFSTNEGIEEVATGDLQYFLLPALLGSLCLKITSGNRKDITTVSEVYFKDFLQRCSDYGICSEYKCQQQSSTEEETDERAAQKQELNRLIHARAGKIQRFKEQKELKSRLEDLKKNMDNEHADEEIKRNYFLTMIRLYTYEAVDELDCILSEKQILERMALLNKEEKPKSKRPPPPPLRPVIITKDEVQKAVFGAGYPSLPVFSVKEFYDQRVRDGIFPDPTKKQQGPMSLQQASIAGVSLNDDQADVEKEQKLDTDDPETLERMRQQDEFKDEHRRGWGNRMNRS